jgi:hypothetical protein
MKFFHSIEMDLKRFFEAICFFAHGIRMAFSVEKNEAAAPIDIRFFHPQAVMLDPQMPANAIQQLRTGEKRRWGSGHYEAVSGRGSTERMGRNGARFQS